MATPIKAYIVNFLEDPSYTFVYVPQRSFHEEVAFMYFKRTFLDLIDNKKELERFATASGNVDGKYVAEVKVHPETVQFLIDHARKRARQKAMLEKHGARFMELVERSLKQESLEKIVEKKEQPS